MLWCVVWIHFRTKAGDSQLNLSPGSVIDRKKLLCSKVTFLSCEQPASSDCSMEGYKSPDPLPLLGQLSRVIPVPELPIRLVEVSVTSARS